MPKALPLLPLFLFFYCLSYQALRAQRPVTNQVQLSPAAFKNSINVHILDSIYILHRDRYGTNRASVPRQPAGSILPRNTKVFATSLPVRAMLQNATSNHTVDPSSRTNTICYTISGRDYLKQDSLILYTGNPTLTADGNVIVSGEYAAFAPAPVGFLNDGGFCMKTDIQGNVIWAKLFDSVGMPQYGFTNFNRSLELRNGNILLAGRIENQISGNEDFILTMLDNNGNMIWLKTYESKFWQGFNGSGDLFGLLDLQEDPATGDIYFSGYHWEGYSTITKIDPSDGHVTWSNAYHTFDLDRTFGMVINSNNLMLFTLGLNGASVNAIAVNKINGDTLYSKTWHQTNGVGIYGTNSVVKLQNGHYRMSGLTVGNFEYPVYTGTVDLFHAAIIELDENLDFVKAWGFKNRSQDNGFNTRISLFPDGSGVFTMLDFISGYNANVNICLFKDDLIYHQRKRIQINEGVPFEPATLQLSDGGFLNIKLLGDSTVTADKGSHVDYYRMHTSDTASLCLGVKDSITSVYYFKFETANKYIDSIHRNVFRLSRPVTYDEWNFATTRLPACVVVSNCDTLHIDASQTSVCPGTDITFSVHKNKECGSLVPFEYDTNFVRRVTKLDDTTYQFRFEQPGSGYIHASLMGCALRKDSVLIRVSSARFSLNLGVDTVICPGNQILLNAHKGFDSYVWQDGSTDSMYTVTTAGKYYVTASNSCGGSYSDTVVVNDHPPVPISIGPDRSKCNNDTLHLNAPAGFLNYKWSANYNISSLTGQQVIVNPLVDTVYTIMAEKEPGCFAYDTVRITVNTSPKINLGKDTSICAQDSLVLDAGPGFNTYLWSTGNNNQQLSIKVPGTYSIKAITPAGCSSFDTLKLVGLYALPQPNLGPDSVVCAGKPRTLSTPGQFISYSWNTGAVGNTISVDAPGQYWLTVTDANGCHGSDTTIVPSVEPPPSGFLNIDTAICQFGDVKLVPSQTYQQYLWSTGATQGFITVNQAGAYWLEVTDNNNCQGKDTAFVTIKNDCLEGLYVPNAFSPNGDGKNDLFRPLLFGNVQSFRFQIFNRWGELVYQTSTIGAGWNGQYKGHRQDSDTFVWVCIYQLKGQKTEKRNGTFVVIR